MEPTVGCGLPLLLIYIILLIYIGVCGWRARQTHHACTRLLRDRRVERVRNRGQVAARQQLHVHARETVEEGLWQALAAAALLQRVLRGKEAEACMALEDLAQLWDENLHTTRKVGQPHAELP